LDQILSRRRLSRSRPGERGSQAQGAKRGQPSDRRRRRRRGRGREGGGGEDEGEDAAFHRVAVATESN